MSVFHNVPRVPRVKMERFCLLTGTQTQDLRRAA
jgi:hypothetical protein